MSDKKVGFVVTHAGDDPEMATLPFMLATGALSMGVEPVIILQSDAVALGVPGSAETVCSEGLAPLASLLHGLLDSGVRMMVCSPCMTKRGITEEMLLPGCYVGGAGLVVTAMLECENLLRY